MDKIKEAFQKVRGDITNLYKEVNSLKSELRETREELLKICDILKHISKTIEPEPKEDNSTDRRINLTYESDIPAHKEFLEALNSQNKPFSTGNEGVPADRQTDRQTDTSSINNIKITTPYNKIDQNSIDEAAKMLDSLDNIKKELRITFKRLTDQEVLVFSAIYQIDEEKGYTDYKTLAEKLNLTESSIRDYIGRLIKKGIPLEKKKINNKIIQISVSNNLKRIASLSTILQLRDM